jgi:hypothetical protein
MIALLAAAAISIAAPNQAAIQRGEAALMDILKDPDSAKLSGVFVHDGNVCGYFNAKNGYGGYVGRAGWIAGTSLSTDGSNYIVAHDLSVGYTGSLEVQQEFADMFAGEWLKACGSTFVP